MNVLLTIPVALPLAAAALSLLARGRRTLQRAVTVGAVGGVLAAGIALVAASGPDAASATQVGGWPAGIAIPLVADPLAALLVTVAAVMVAGSVVLAVAREEDTHPLFHPLVLVLTAGVLGAFLTADLFNLFVFFEVMLAASYVLLVLRGGPRAVRAGAVYVTVNLLASTVLLAGIALLYGVTGTVNLGELYGAAADPGAALATGVIVVAMAAKAAVVPLHGWLPRTYPEASPAVTALFSGLLTKAGVYVLYRLASVVFAGEPPAGPVVAGVLALTMVAGVLGAVGRGDVRGILAFHMVSQVGYLLVPLALFTTGMVTAGVFYLVQYIVVKGSLFLAAGAVETIGGSGSLAQLGGLARRRPLLALAFGLSALSLAGIPPLSGFFGKVALVTAAFDGGAYALGAVMVAVSLLTLLSMVKIWNGAFWGDTPAHAPPRADRAAVAIPAGASDGTASFTPPPPLPRARVAALVAPALVTAGLTAAVGLWPEGLFGLAESAADALTAPDAYLEAVRRS